MMNITGNSDTFVEVYPIKNPDYMTVYDWENSIELTVLRKWVGKNWKMSVYASAIYVVLIYCGQSWMKNRPAYDLRRWLTTWNIVLAIFSFIGFMRTAPELFHVLSQPYGFYTTVCTRRGHNAATAFWGFLMTMSKSVELGDTVFIVLRKQPLRFLHWYHHVTVFIYVFCTYEEYDPSLRWFMVMNMFVHAVMYTYYSLKAMRIRVPRNWAMLVTVLQLSQMVVGVYINIYSLWIKKNGMDCVRRHEVIQLALTMYGSYFVLFTNFFYNSYLKQTSSLLRKKAD